ncbi:serine/threonine-protein kinase [Actinomadura sp. 9N407]|uniref:serine/threonine-protein kinase n=1 Tax=Actinomadura sp. 9N407 TaxID=3375154 RepID=UPI0037A83361
MAPLRPGDPEEIGGYRLLGRLGAGGMGLVFLGRSPAGLMVAIKVIHERFAHDPNFRARFRREVTTARAVSGAFTAPVIDADPEAPSPWLVTTFLEGKPLNEAVAEHGALPAPAVAALGAGLAEALISIHRAGIVHRDLKPHNVMLSPDGPKVIDFGIAHAADVSAITQAGAVVGSPGYMSPEQARGLDTGPAGDVFSLGAVLAFAATGQGPFGRALLQVMVYRVVHEEPRLGGIEDPRLRQLIAACLDKDPSRRPAPQLLLHWLGTAAPQGVSWLPASLAADISQSKTLVPVRRGRRAVLFGAAGLGLLVAGGGAAAAASFAGGGEPAPRDTTPKGTLVRRISVGRGVGGGPVLAKGLAIVGTDNGELHAFDVATGSERWRYDPATSPEPLTRSPFNSPPFVAGDVIYAVSDIGILHAVGMADGKRKWAERAGQGRSAPVVSGEHVYLRTGLITNTQPSFVVHDLTGALKGRTRMPLSDPVTDGRQVYVAMNGKGVAVFAGGRQSGVIPDLEADVLTLADGVLYGAKLQPGRLWAYDTKARRRLWDHDPGVSFGAGPAVSEGMVYVPGSGGGLLAFQVSGGKVSRRWRLETGRIEAPPAFAGGVVYAGAADHNVYAVDAASGKPRWRFTAEGGFRMSTPVVAGGVVYVGSQDSYLYVLRA